MPIFPYQMFIIIENKLPINFMNLELMKNDQSQQEIEGPLILGSVVGSVCLLVIVGIIIICLRMKKRNECGKDAMIDGNHFLLSLNV